MRMYHGTPFVDTIERVKVNYESLGLIAPVMGGERGYNVEQDALLTHTTDGRDLNAIWTEYQRTVQMKNAERNTLINLLTYGVTQNIEDVMQFGGEDFEEATQFGVPRSATVEGEVFSMGYTFKWYDLAVRYTWQFLAEADNRQLDALHQSALEADNRLLFGRVMRTLFDNRNRNATIKGQNYTVYALYNGDGTVPPSYGGNSFAGTETHYLVSGADVIDSGDLEDLIRKLDRKGYSTANGTQQLILMNSDEEQHVRRFRANVANNNGAVALYDFIPAVGEAALLADRNTVLLGNQPASQYRGVRVIGSYGNALIGVNDFIPSGYVTIIGSGGQGALTNVIGIREHTNRALRGLRLIAGDRQGYPLVNSYYSRGFGTGIRQRGGAAVMQIKATGDYEIPTQYANAL